MISRKEGADDCALLPMSGGIEIDLLVLVEMPAIIHLDVG
jgi:hypothetical protein